MKYKVGDTISDEDGWRSVEEVGDDGTLITADEDGEEMEEYNADNRVAYNGYIVKIGNKDLSAYTYRLFQHKGEAKRFAENEIKRLKRLGVTQYYRVEEAPIRICHCGRMMIDDGSQECLMCEKIRDDAYQESLEEGDYL